MRRLDLAFLVLLVACRSHENEASRALPAASAQAVPVLEPELGQSPSEFATRARVLLAEPRAAASSVNCDTPPGPDHDFCLGLTRTGSRLIWHHTDLRAVSFERQVAREPTCAELGASALGARWTPWSEELVRCRTSELELLIRNGPTGIHVQIFTPRFLELRGDLRALLATQTNPAH